MNFTACIAILALAALEGIALAKNVDGATFGLVIAAIAGLGGYQVRKSLAARRHPTPAPDPTDTEAK